MNEHTYGYTFTMRAKPGRGEELRSLLAAVNGEAEDVRSWLIGTADSDVDSLIGFEFYDDEAAAAAHDNDPNVAEIQATVRELLAEPPARTIVQPTATSPSLLRD